MKNSEKDSDETQQEWWHRYFRQIVAPAFMRRCSKCDATSLRCTVCAETSMTRKMFSNRTIFESRGKNFAPTVCKDCRRPACQDPECTTCRACRHPACVDPECRREPALPERGFSRQPKDLAEKAAWRCDRCALSCEVCLLRKPAGSFSASRLQHKTHVPSVPVRRAKWKGAAHALLATALRARLQNAEIPGITSSL